MRATIPNAAPRCSYLIIAVCFCVAIFEGFDLQAPSVAASQLRSAFNLSPMQLGAFFSAGTVGLLFGAAIGGLLSDRYGRKPVLIGSTLWFSIGSFANAHAPDLETLLLSRLLTGIGMGATLPTLIAIASEAAAPNWRGRAVTFVFSGLSIGGAAASLLAGWTAAATDWRIVFLCGAVVPLIFSPALFTLPASKVAARKEPPGGRFSELFGRENGRTTALLWTASFFLMIAIYLLSNWLPTLLQDRGLSRSEALNVQFIFNLAGIVGAIATGRLLDRPPAQRSIGIATLYGGFLASILMLAIAPPTPLVIMVLGGLVGMMTTAVAAVLYAIAPALYSAQVRGTGIGLGVAAGRVGSIIGPLIAGILLGAGFSSATVLVAMLPLIAIAAACAVTIGRAAARLDASRTGISQEAAELQ
jgi:AAHS family 3-hydroxyphenylpropionic acid transporter